MSKGINEAEFVEMRERRDAARDATADYPVSTTQYRCRTFSGADNGTRYLKCP